MKSCIVLAKSASLIAIVSLVGCYAHGDTTTNLTVQIEGGFSDAQLAAISASINNWLDMTGDDPSTLSIVVSGNPCGTQEEGYGNTTCIHPSTSEIIAGFDSDSMELGVTEMHGLSGSSDIYLPLDKLSTIDLFTTVITHELGHAMGLEHTQTGTVMCAGTWCQSKQITCDDVAQYLAIRGLNNYTDVCPNGGSFYFTGK